MNSREGEMEIQKGEAAAAEAAGADVMAPSRLRRICVFCGSSKGKKASYQDAAVELGQELVARNIDLVYGGGGLGLMGVVSQAVYSGGRHVVGVIPTALMSKEKYHMHEMFEEAGDTQQVPLLLGTLDLTNEHPPFKITGETIGEVKVVSDMHQRKAEMTRLSDAFIALPGGYGTLEELFEAITWAQLGIHDKPVGVLNVDGYYDALVSYIDTAVEEGFIQPTARHIMVLAPTPKELLDKLETYSPRHKEVAPKMKWELDQKVSCSEEHVVPAQCGNML